MTGLQELQDAILSLDAQLAGKYMELAYALGERDIAHKHRLAMEQAIKAQRDFRIKCGTEGGGCFFNASGHADQVHARGAN